MMNERQMGILGIGGALFLLLLIGSPQGALGASAVTVVNNGDPANRVDIAILGDGYTAAEMDKYANDVQQFLQGVFDQEPFREYQRYFNVHRIDVISNESGADHPEQNPPVFKDTALGATYDCAGIQRLICVDSSEVLAIASDSLPSTQRDLLLVIVNDPEYGGSGGAVAVASTNSAAVEIILHELGHSFGLLADEYGGPPPPPCNASIEPPEPNVTMQTQRALIKWNAWIDPSTPIPTLTTFPGIPGLYEGAKYCDNGLFRPTYNSKMRSLGVPYEQINTEQLIKRIYNLASPLDNSTPVSSNVRLAQGQSQIFGVATPAPLTHALMVTWFVDGQLQGTGSFFTLETSTLAVGSHTVEVVVEDTTAMVLNDPDQLLIERRFWNVTVALSDTTPPVITVSASPATLWPPNGKMVPVTISGTITDPDSGVNASTATYAVIDEYGIIQPSGRITLGSNGSYAFTIQLQASRNGDDKDGRQYTITVSAQDNAGNKGSASTVVTVPHDQGK